MATRTVTCTTSANTLTSNAATVDRSYDAAVSMVFAGPRITMTAVGTTELGYLHDTLYASESFEGVWDFELTGTVIAGDQTQVVWSNTQTDTIQASESHTQTRLTSLSDTVSASETAGPVIWDANLWPTPRERFYEHITVFLSETLTDSVTVTDTFPLIGRTLEREDVVYVQTPVITSSVEHTETLSATVDASESIVHGASEELITGNAVNVTDTFTDTVSPNTTHVETLTATGTITSNADVNATLLDVIEAAEATLTASLVANQSVHETLTATEVLWASDFAALAWVLNTETAGLSTYDNFGYNSVAAQNGVLYATSPEGVFALNGDKDGSRNIAARVKTGMLDFDIPTTKRISDVFIGYTGGRLQYEVETYDSATDVYTYEMPERDSAAPRNNRVKPGKGLSSRYWRFGIENIDGADFQLHNQTAVVAASKRRL